MHMCINSISMASLLVTAAPVFSMLLLRQMECIPVFLSTQWAQDIMLLSTSLRLVSQSIGVNMASLNSNDSFRIVYLLYIMYAFSHFQLLLFMNMLLFLIILKLFLQMLRQ